MNIENRIELIEDKVDTTILRNTEAFERLNITMDAICETMNSICATLQILSNQVIENQKITMELAINVYQLKSEVKTILETNH